MTFDEMYELGNVGRNWAIERLDADRWTVIPLDELPARDGHGPQLFGGSAPVLPDLQIMKAGQSLAVEVKTKTDSTHGRLTDGPEHGIDRIKFDQYREYDKQMPTFLLIVEVGLDRLRRDAYIARITELRTRHSNNNGTHMAYWPRAQMTSDWLMRLNRCIAQREYRRG